MAVESSRQKPRALVTLTLLTPSTLMICKEHQLYQSLIALHFMCKVGPVTGCEVQPQTLGQRCSCKPRTL